MRVGGVLSSRLCSAFESWHGGAQRERGGARPPAADHKLSKQGQPVCHKAVGVCGVNFTMPIDVMLLISGWLSLAIAEIHDMGDDPV